MGALVACGTDTGDPTAANDVSGREQRKKPKVKNIILLIGDGMQLEHEIAISRYLYGSDFGLSWDGAPFRAPVSTWDVTAYNTHAAQLGVAPYDSTTFDPSVGYDVARGGEWPYPLSVNQDDAYLLAAATDSASAATAWATGYKTDGGNIAWLAGDPPGGALTTIAEYMRAQRGTALGVVSTVPFTHATPAAHVAHNVYRNNYDQIAQEIISVTRPEVVIGGGAPVANADGSLTFTTYLPRAQYDTLMADSEYLVVQRELGVDGNQSLAAAAAAVDLARGDKLFGLFGGSAGNFAPAVPSDTPGAPSIARGSIEDPQLRHAAVAALEVLSQDPDGLFVMIEQGDIDWANHDNDYARMIGTAWSLNETLKGVLEFVSRPNDDVEWSNTLVMVTADHGNSYMRLVDAMRLGPGDLPAQVPAPADCPYSHCGRFIYPDGDVTYASDGHTNELVMLYAFGRGLDSLAKRRGSWYPDTVIIDNTQIFDAMAEVTGIDVE